jgi:predicted site-specific integrase-resolvase
MELFSRYEIAGIFKISVKTVYRYERRGIIKPSLYVGRAPRYAVEELEKIATEKRRILTTSN